MKSACKLSFVVFHDFFTGVSFHVQTVRVLYILTQPCKILEKSKKERTKNGSFTFGVMVFLSWIFLEPLNIVYL